MSTNVDPVFIKAQLIAGSYPDNTLNDFNIFDYEQKETRRHYPSAEIVYIPESLSEDKKQTDKTLGFEIRYYDKIVGGRSEQLVILKQVEDQIISIINTTTLEDPNILLQTFQWERKHESRDRNHPEYNVSILKIFVKTRLEAGQVNDAILTYDDSNSTVLTPPGSNYTYTQVYDTEISSGYRTHEEQVTSSPFGIGTPIRFRGGWNGKLITHIHIKSTDLGSTGDKVNQFTTLLSNGEKPIIGLIFKANTDDSPTIHQITETFKVDIERVERAYQYQDITVYRVFGELIAPGTVTST